MANPYYAEGEQRVAKVKDLFAAIAPRYDLINDLQSFGLHRRWKRQVARLAETQPGTRALDVCCGTGDIAFALAARGVEVVGLDFSGPMLEVAAIRTAAPKHVAFPCPPRFIRGDALQIPFPDESFDIVTVGYGLRNLADWKGGLSEMLRVARPGGRLLVLDFGKPRQRVWRGMYFGYLRLAVPMFGRLFCGDAAAYAYILESLQHYPAQAGVEQQMRALGCVDVRVVNVLGGVMSINFGRKAKS